MTDRLKKLHAAERAVKLAEEWNDLPNGKRYQNDTFAISIAHCKAPVFTRGGQKYASGKNYWQTEDSFNRAALEYFVETWEQHYPKILEKLKKKEAENLIACQTFIDEMQAAIDEARNNR